MTGLSRLRAAYGRKPTDTMDGLLQCSISEPNKVASASHDVTIIHFALCMVMATGSWPTYLSEQHVSQMQTGCHSNTSDFSHEPIYKETHQNQSTSHQSRANNILQQHGGWRSSTLIGLNIFCIYITSVRCGRRSPRGQHCFCRWMLRWLINKPSWDLWLLKLWFEMIKP